MCLVFYRHKVSKYLHLFFLIKNDHIKQICCRITEDMWSSCRVWHLTLPSFHEMFTRISVDVSLDAATEDE